jgi:uncharacterized protein (DUF1501 family)
MVEGNEHDHDDNAHPRNARGLKEIAMLNHDISTADALAQLSFRDDGPNGYNRRKFLQMIAMGAGGAALGSIGGPLFDGVIGNQLRDAWASGPIGPQDGVLVIVGMYGGNDGMNTVIPYTNGKYYDYRQGLAIPQNQVLAIDGNVGLHPNLTFLKSLYDSGQVAIVQGLGVLTNDPDLSHFSSMARWMSASDGPPSSGWIGRWTDGLGGAQDIFQTATVGSSVPLHLVGNTRRGTAIPEGGLDFGGGTDPSDQRMNAAMRAFANSSGGRGPWHDAIALAERSQIDVAQTVGPLFAAALPDSEIAKKLTIAARLINADLGLRVIDTSWGDFDTHAHEPYDHGQRMMELDEGLAQFFGSLDGRFSSRVTVMTFSEFGRTPWSNDSTGTDHGTTNNHFVIGSSVRGGLYGQQPSLVNLKRWDRTVPTVDYRSLYATVLDSWLGGGASAVLGGNFENLGLFNSPGTGGVGTPPTGVQFSDFVGLPPVRILDSRIGMNTAKSPMAPASTRSVQVTGRGGVPTTGVMAAVLNITAVNSTMPSFFTVWPAGTTRPNASTLNVAGGDVVPNLAVAMIGDSGRVNIFNSTGSVDCIVDVVGYFLDGNSSRYTPLTPQRILDTRDGTGAPKTSIGPRGVLDLQVAGHGGVVGDADSVVMNVTVTGPTATSYITVWPTGQTMPTASNLNMIRNQTAPNLVIAKLGAGGRVSMLNDAGNTHLIADVLGYFKPGVGARLTPVTPQRVLDTRSGIGAPTAPIGQTPLVLGIAGHGGVPVAGASAVILNVTAVQGSSGTYVTVYPSGETRPIASNLNVDAGQIRANLVISKIGANGAVELFNDKGAVHLIADVVGYFTTAG